MESISGRRIVKLVAVPAVISLAVTLLRLTGELARWSETFFNREPGGPGSIVGIVWLAPLFGVYFALKLHREGSGPSSPARAVGLAALGVAAMGAVGAAGALLPHPLLRILAINVASAVGALVASRGWIDLAKTEAVYGLAARVPVAAIMLVAMYADWGTHYELGPPGMPEMSVFATWLWAGLLPQMVFWIGYTVMSGSLLGSIAVLFVRPRNEPV